MTYPLDKVFRRLNNWDQGYINTSRTFDPLSSKFVALALKCGRLDHYSKFW